ncbi:MAG: GNAT family N-acetyltransferase [Anaerolineaceae bacterium]|nr:GNAT family N-acetyltransferase [Anaerolineaceae bacterium]
MIGLGTKLYESEHLLMTPVDLDQDPAVVSEWTLNMSFAQWLSEDPALPMAAYELKRMYEKQLKEADENGRKFYFAIRRKEEKTLAGFIRFPYVVWVENFGNLHLDVPDSETLQQYGSEILHMALDYAFRELNLFVVSVRVAEYDATLRSLLLQTGFQQDVCMREAIYRNGRYWDQLIFTIHSSDWLKA